MLEARVHGPVTGFRLARTLLGKGRYHTACYYVDGLLMDSGCAHTVGELGQALEGRSLMGVALSHGHEDHVAGAEPLRASRGARVWAPALTLPMLRGTETRPPLFPYQKVLWGWPAVCPEAQELPPVLETEHYRFEVIATPGHSPDHVCFHETNEGWLFCGDAYVGGRDRALRRGYDVWGIIASLKKLARRDYSLIFTGSGSVVTDPARALAEKIEYLEDRGRYVLELHRRGWPVKIIAKSVFGRKPFIAYVTQGNFNRRNLVLSYLEGAPKEE